MQNEFAIDGRVRRDHDQNALVADRRDLARRGRHGCERGETIFEKSISIETRRFAIEGLKRGFERDDQKRDTTMLTHHGVRGFVDPIGSDEAVTPAVVESIGERLRVEEETLELGERRVG